MRNKMKKTPKNTTLLRPNCGDYDKQKISVVICDTDIPYRFTKSSCGGERKSFEMVTSA